MPAFVAIFSLFGMPLPGADGAAGLASVTAAFLAAWVAGCLLTIFGCALAGVGRCGTASTTGFESLSAASSTGAGVGNGSEVDTGAGVETGVGAITAVAPVQRLRTASVSAACSIATAQARTLLRTANVGAACSIALSADREGPGAQPFPTHPFLTVPNAHVFAVARSAGRAGVGGHVAGGNYRTSACVVCGHAVDTSHRFCSRCG